VLHASTKFALLALVIALGATTPAFARALVRVNQIGYAPAAAKRAYLMSSAPETGARFVVRSANGVVRFRSAVRGSPRRWSARYPYVYPLAFDGVKAPGSYTIAVSGPVAARSPGFRIAGPVELYGQPLENALRFYQVERDGPDYIRSPLRTAPAHLNDEHTQTYRTPRTNSNGNFQGDLSPLGKSIDASGGWWDAGDYLKFVETTSYVVDLMLVGVRDFPRQMGVEAGASNFTGEARFGLDWLMRMWDERSRTLYYQVGIAEGNNSTAGDHDIWRLPQADDTYRGSDPTYRYIRHRPVFRAGPPGSRVSPNLAGRDAAAFALCFQVFRHAHESLATTCLRQAEVVYALANTHPGKLTTAIPHGFYPETEWRDDMELAAVELADALAGGHLPARLMHKSSAYYLRRAARWARAYMHQADDASDPLNLYDVSGLADYELYRAMRSAPQTTGLAVKPVAVLGDLRKQLDGAITQAGRDPFGFGFPWNAYDSTSHGAGLSVLASEYASLTRDRAARAWSVRWLDNILGANAWGSSFIIGDGSTFPRCPQHQVANLVGSLNGAPPVLAGAVVEGPNQSASSGFVSHMRRCPPGGGDAFAPFDSSRGVFRDNVQSYSTDEPAIDLTASSLLAFAWQIRGS
jgi:endoglucanase